MKIKDRIAIVREYKSRKRGVTKTKFLENKNIALKTFEKWLTDYNKGILRTHINRANRERAPKGSKHLPLEEIGLQITNELERLNKDGAGMVYVSKSKLVSTGLGLFATKDIPANLPPNIHGRLLFKYEGKIVPKKDIKDVLYAATLSRRNAIDAAEEFSGFGRYMNHQWYLPSNISDGCNCFLANVNRKEIGVYVFRNIKKDEELTIDYGRPYWGYNYNQIN